MAQTIQFTTGSLIIDDTYVSFQTKDKTDKISRKNIAFTEQTNTNEVVTTPNKLFVWSGLLWVTGGAVLVIKFLLIFVGIGFFDGGNIVAYALYAVLIGAGVNFLSRLGGNSSEARDVVLFNIHNTQGADLSFVVLPNEVHNVPNIDNFKIVEKVAPKQANDLVTELSKLNELKEKGVLSLEEYEAMKKKAMGL